MRCIILCGGARENTIKHLFESGGVEISKIYIPDKIKIIERLKKVIAFAEANNIAVEKVSKEQCNELDNHNSEVLISLGWNYKVSSGLISKFKYAINVHPTLLPKYRGYRSGAYILINGEKQSGVTVHLLEDGIDNGDIIYQEVFDISVFDTPKSMKEKIDKIEGPALVKALLILQSGESSFTKQNEQEATYYDKIRTPEDSVVDWECSLKDLYNQIRACDPDDYPAFFWLEGEKVYIRLYRKNKSEKEAQMI